MRDQDFELFADLLKRTSGLSIGPDKQYLLETRLTPLALKNGLAGLDALADEVRFRKPAQLIDQIVEAMTTNESFFFRDTTPFDILKAQILPKLHEARGDKKKLNIWCGAASTGQEPYSIAMLLAEDPARWAGWDINILATDISKDALAKAEEGSYSQFEVQRGLPVNLMLKYFRQEGERWLISDDIKRRVTFKPFNLLQSPSGLGRFDVVFLRNVLIYFDSPTKAVVFEKVRSVMERDGALFLGAAETVLGVTEQFRSIKGLRGLYVPTEHAHEASLRFAATG
ncbi:MAG: protein-glutamate O-methyltransferase CheR [Pseudomonadota bacterium]